MNTKTRILEHIQSKGFSPDEAVKIYNAYTREKIILIDKNGGWFYSHGAFADRGMMLNALRRNENNQAL